MVDNNVVRFSVAIPSKVGELSAIAALPIEIASVLDPHIVLVAPSEKDQQTRTLLDQSQAISIVPKNIAKFWSGDCFVDPRNYVDAYTLDDDADWLVNLFKNLWESGCHAVPVLRPAEIMTLSRRVLGALGGTRSTRLAIRLDLSDLQELLMDRQFLARSLEKISVPASQLVLIVDYGENGISNVERSANQIRALIDIAFVVGAWQRIVIETSSFPKIAGIEQDSVSRFPRNEMAVYDEVMKFGGYAFSKVNYGDFSTNTADFRPIKANAKPLPHQRYTVDDKYIVSVGSRVRGYSTMREVGSKLKSEDGFRPRTFSPSEDFSWRCSLGGSVGSPTDWRMYNTLQHIYFVYAQIAEKWGLRRAPAIRVDSTEQVALF